MRVAILAGGRGSRLSEETHQKPKPMVEIGGRPILWHIMQIYAQQGFRDFAIALGYKGECIKRYMIDYCALHSDLTIEIARGQVHTSTNSPIDDWTVRLVDTGATTGSGGRLRRLAPHLGEGTFLMTWGDGVANVDLKKLVDFHRGHGKLATVTAVRPPPRFGRLDLVGDRVAEFAEKPPGSEGWINGGFFVLEPEVAQYVDGDESAWEDEPMERLVRDGQLMAYRHEDFWQCMDTLRDKERLQELWDRDEAPWKLWK